MSGYIDCGRQLSLQKSRANSRTEDLPFIFTGTAVSGN
jgi:hypothetical protein